MKRLLFPCLCVLALLLSMSRVGHAAALPVCDLAQLKAYAPALDEVAAHRQFTVPMVSYPFDTKHDSWGLALNLRVDELGRVVCYRITADWWMVNRDAALDHAEQVSLAGMAGWRYAPFVQGGMPTAAVVQENVPEQELPQHHVPLPQVPLAQVRIHLSREGCFGTCPSYAVDIDGSGAVVWHGDSYVDVVGEQRYTIPTEAVAQLVESARIKDLWSLRPAYRSTITDNPDNQLTLSMGTQVHNIDDYVGQIVGMPAAVSEFEAEVDKAANTSMWINLTMAGVKQLQQAGFAFRSRAGADLLARAVGNRSTRDDQALLELIELGTPLDGHVDDGFSVDAKQYSVLEQALRQHRETLVAPLIAHGALLVDGKPDQGRIDAAFQAAIAGGRLTPVLTLWNTRGERAHPLLHYQDKLDSESKDVPVTLLLSRKRYSPDPHWEGLAIVQWLAALGCDLKAQGVNGRTLLHIAAEANDAAMVRYLLAQGLDPSVQDDTKLPALGSADNEDVAMLLLEAGTDPSPLDNSGTKFRAYAEGNHWQRVLAWLDAHHQK